MLEETGADSVRTVARVEGAMHPYWMYSQLSDGKAKPFMPDINTDQFYQRQLLPDVYRLNGVADAIRSDSVLSPGSLYGADMRLLEVNERDSMDIDTEMDFIISDLLLKHRPDIFKTLN